MKSKQHEYILKAFLNSSIPAVIRRSSPELMVIDSVIGGYCSNCSSTGMEKDELVLYYRLAILVESILIQYREQHIPKSNA